MYFDNNFIDDNFNKYINKIEEKVNSTTTKNIALMTKNNYETSIIFDYLKKRNPKKYMNVYISDINHDEQINKINDEKLCIIQKNILSQLANQIPSWEIPYSKFKKECVNKNYVKLHIWWFIVFLLSLLITIPTIIFFHRKNWVILTNEFIFLLLWISFPISLIFFSYFLFIFIHWIYKMYRKDKIPNFKFFKALSEIDLKNNNSNIDELIHLFNSTKFDTIIFKDIEEYNYLKLMNILRDWNINLNNSSYLRNKKITFIYLLKDNHDKDKYKFFDEII